MSDQKSVLVIDDENYIHDAIRIALEKIGIEVVCCSSGMEALELAQSRRFCVIVTDYQMPEMTGAVLTELLRTRLPGSYIIGLSGEKREKDFLDAGANAFFKKPFPFGDLISLIEQKVAV